MKGINPRPYKVLQPDSNGLDFNSDGRWGTAPDGVGIRHRPGSDDARWKGSSFPARTVLRDSAACDPGDHPMRQAFTPVDM